MKSHVKLATHWWRKAARRGYSRAQFELASAYYDGRGVSRGLARAAYYYEAAARQRLAVALLYIAVMYGDSLGVPRNEVQAAAWFRKAADQGHVAA